MNADPFHADAAADLQAADLQDGAAVIHPVTPEVMEAAARKAASLAIGVADHTVALDESAGVDAQAGEAVAVPASDTARSLERVADAGETAPRVAGDAVETVGAAQAQAAEATAPVVDQAGGRAASPAEAGLSEAFGRYNALLVETVRANMAATGDLFAALVQARSVPEAVAINADHLRRQFDALTGRGREFADLAQTLTLDALKPFTESRGRDR